MALFGAFSLQNFVNAKEPNGSNIDWTSTTFKVKSFELVLSKRVKGTASKGKAFKKVGKYYVALQNGQAFWICHV